MSAVNDSDDAIIVALGSNLRGAYTSPEALLEAALAEFETAGVHVLARSSWWKSAAWPDPAGPEYRNGVAIVETDLSPALLMAALRGIETAFGRTRGEANAARTLDLDLIAYGRLITSDGRLTIPHPRAHDRLFVMGPLAQIRPDWRHPQLNRSAQALASTATIGRDATPGPIESRRRDR